MVLLSSKSGYNPLLSVFPVVHLEAPCVGLRIMGILLRHDARLLLWDSAGLGGQWCIPVPLDLYMLGSTCYEGLMTYCHICLFPHSICESLFWFLPWPWWYHVCSDLRMVPDLYPSLCGCSIWAFCFPCILMIKPFFSVSFT